MYEVSYIILTYKKVRSITYNFRAFSDYKAIILFVTANFSNASTLEQNLQFESRLSYKAEINVLFYSTQNLNNTVKRVTGTSFEKRSII